MKSRDAAPKPHVSLRVDVPPGLYGRISEFRHAKRFESRGLALTALLVAGLAALAEQIALPVAAATPAKPRKLDPYAGADRRERPIEKVAGG